LEHLERLAGEEGFTEFADVNRDLLVAIPSRGDRPVVSFAKSEFAFGQSVILFHFEGILPLRGSAITVPVLVVEGVGGIIKGFQPGIAGIRLIDGAGPAEALVVTDRRQGTSEESCAREIQ